jgi:hypothetical protein
MIKKDIKTGEIEYFSDKGQFKHHGVKEFMDQFMPRANKNRIIFRTFNDLK